MKLYPKRRVFNARDKLYLYYLLISHFVLILFTIVFTIQKFYLAAFFEAIMLVPFCTSFYLFLLNRLDYSKWIAVTSSLVIVMIQTNVIFTPSSGFQYMLIPLLVISFLFNDLNQFRNRIFGVVFSIIICFGYFISSSYQFFGPVLSIDSDINHLFRIISTIVSFVALIFMLYMYSLQLAKTEANLSYLADHDALTKIYNRGYFASIGQAYYLSHKEKKLPLSAIIFDIDNFKSINDNYGHHIGDVVLKDLAITVNAIIRSNYIFARYGGEEFAILLENTHLEHTLQIAEGIRSKLASLCVAHQNSCINFTVSLGVATLSDKHHSFEDVMKDADKALYISKYRGKNQTNTI
ncbi:MAG: hypothetical protein BGO41_00170 [Clostridiales bacterium 38-18]|nr:MAG: hypothetical protein BGO41_00170 [Clostridiales bacterium 38-18]